MMGRRKERVESDRRRGSVVRFHATVRQAQTSRPSAFACHNATRQILRSHCRMFPTAAVFLNSDNMLSGPIQGFGCMGGGMCVLVIINKEAPTCNEDRGLLPLPENYADCSCSSMRGSYWIPSQYANNLRTSSLTRGPISSGKASAAEE